MKKRKYPENQQLAFDFDAQKPSEQQAAPIDAASSNIIPFASKAKQAQQDKEKQILERILREARQIPW